MPQHRVNAIEEEVYAVSIDEVVTPLKTVKKNLLRAGLFPGCSEGCLFCAVSLSGCPLLKLGIQEQQEITFLRYAI